uniref:hypothetical protein n=1 Tax=Streptomyces sp. CA-136453 TaxID=3240050 RepID=UPI003F4992F8
MQEGIAPRTAIWLNELQRYVGEQAAAGLRNLLQDSTSGPVLVLATVWPEFFSALTAPPVPGGPDPYPQARSLLEGTALHVLDAFDTQAWQDARTVGGHDPQRAVCCGRR